MNRFKWYLMDTENGGAGSAGGNGGDGSSGDGDQKPAAIDPAEYESLKTQLASFQESIAKLESNNKALMQEKVEAKKAAEKAAMDAAKKSGDVEAVEKSWNEKYTALESILNETSQRYERMIQNLTVGATASRLAADLAIQGSADVLLPHISARLAVEIKDDKPLVRVLDKDGKPSAMSIKELQAEFAANPSFAPIIAGSKASGSGFNNNRANWSGGDGNRIITRTEFSAMNQAERQKIAPLLRKGEVKLVEA
ncbi:hypothetical protein [Nitrosomonas communis]|uniref:hypothetical protein n=1 Tax=Nitrosomonas communis TaxID=44574 RepID=UPI0026EDFC99|nr:hypothetical protein [Nitrosomonas communis]MCO6428900.1 hypothetical protein [Nitrosomonas communis]